MNVILYCRVSSDEQTENCSLEMQEQFLKNYCSKHNYNVVDVYREDYSAKHFDMRRPEIKKIYEYCKKHRTIDKILFLRWDRYARNVEFAFSYKRKLYDELNVEINSIESPIDFKGTEWSMLLAMYCGAAQTENNKISRRTKDGIHGTLLKGKCANKAPRGYKNVRTDKNNTHVEIDTTKADTIREVFKEVAKGIESPCYIRRKIAKQIPETSFFEMLRNRFYIGDIFVPAYMDEVAHYVQGEHEALIDKETFYKVQDVLDGKKRQSPKLKKAINPDLFLRQFLICPKCGHALTGATSKGNGGKYTYYFCCKDSKHIRIRAEETNSLFIKYIAELKPNKEVLNLYKEILKELSNEKSYSEKKQIIKLKEELNKVNDRINVIDDKFLDGDLNKEQYDRMLERYTKEASTIQQQVEMRENPNRGNIEPKLNYSINLINNIDSYIKDASVGVKIKLISSMFPEKIEFDGKTYRTNTYNKVLDLIYQETNKLRGEEKKNGESFSTFSASVPRPGVEPGWK